MGFGRRRQLLVALFVLQAVVLLAIVALHGVRMAEGTRVELAVQPVDPTDLVRGSYVDLSWPQLEDLRAGSTARSGDEAYVGLRRPPTRGGTWVVTGVANDPNYLPDVDAFMRLPVSGKRLDTSDISTYYADPDEARRLEADLADGGGVAVVVLGADGSPELDRVLG